MPYNQKTNEINHLYTIFHIYVKKLGLPYFLILLLLELEKDQPTY